MWKYTISVSGMMCGMCEAHINDAIRKACSVKKVTSSHKKGQTVVLAEVALDPEQLRSAINATGYTAGEVKQEPWEKKSLFGLK
jgi:copper chaperone CopZ